MTDNFKLYTENADLLVLKLLRPVTVETLAEIAQQLPEAVNRGPKTILADRCGQEFVAELGIGVEFGKGLGRKLSNLGVRMAILNRPHNPVADVVAAQVHGEGVPLAQFDSESDARAWLAGGLN